MIAAAMQEEALQRANSPEGMERLVHALLFSPALSAVWKDEINRARARDLFNCIRRYVRLKRIRAIHRSDKPRRRPFDEYYVGAEEVHAARQDYREVQGELAYRVGMEEVKALKKQWGQTLTLRRILFEDASHIDAVGNAIQRLVGYSVPATEHSIVVHNFHGNTKTESPQ